jgi:hypothetical protein
MKALVEQSGRVAQVVEDGNTFPIHESLSWVDCDGTVTTEHTYDGAVFVAPVVPDPPTYDEMRRRNYPPIGDQLDALYHAGVFPDAMAAEIKKIKDAYAKD